MILQQTYKALDLAVVLRPGLDIDNSSNLKRTWSLLPLDFSTRGKLIEGSIGTTGIMSIQNDLNAAGLETGALSSAPDMQVDVAKGQGLKRPSVEEVLSELAAGPPGLSARGTEPLQTEEQKTLFSSLQEAVNNSENGDEAAVAALKGVRAILDRLWKCNSDYLVKAADVLANGSRNREFSEILCSTH